MGISGKVDKLIKKYKTRCPYEIANMSNISIRREHLPTGMMGVAVNALRRNTESFPAILIFTPTVFVRPRIRLSYIISWT